MLRSSNCLRLCIEEHFETVGLTCTLSTSILGIICNDNIMLAGNICLCSNDIDGENTGQMFRCFWAFYNSVVAPVLLEMCCWHKIQMFPKSWATKVYWFYTIFIWIEYQNKLGNQTFRFANVLNSVVPQFLINVWGIILFEYADFQDSE